MRKLKVSVVYRNDSEYNNKLNAEDYKQLALILLDLKSMNIPIDKAIKEYNRINNSDWNFMLGN